MHEFKTVEETPLFGSKRICLGTSPRSPLDITAKEFNGNTNFCFKMKPVSQFSCLIPWSMNEVNNFMHRLYFSHARL